MDGPLTYHQRQGDDCRYQVECLNSDLQEDWAAHINIDVGRDDLDDGGDYNDDSVFYEDIDAEFGIDDDFDKYIGGDFDKDIDGDFDKDIDGEFDVGRRNVFTQLHA